VERKVETLHPAQLVDELYAQHGGEVPELQVHRPTLEDTYLALLKSHEEA
jgi:ABC-2 type transport system ATP-binding protein